MTYKCKECSIDLHPTNTSDLMTEFCIYCVKDMPLSTKIYQQQRKIKNMNDQLQAKIKDMLYLTKSLNSEKEKLILLEVQIKPAITE